MSAYYSGQIHPKRKQDLFEICEAMGLPGLIDVASHSKNELEDLIRDNLLDNESVRQNPMFQGLWTSMQAMKKPPRHSLASSLVPTDDEVDELASPGPSSALAAASDLAVAAVATPVKRTTQALKRSASGRLALRASRSSQNLKAAADAAKKGSVKVVTGAQERLSKSWGLSTALIVAELGYVSWAALPWVHTKYGPHKWLTRSPTPAFNLPLPDITVLLHSTFTGPLLSWVALFLVLPLVLSILVAAPQSTGRGRSTRQKISPPSAVAFNLFRLATAVLVHVIFARDPDPVKWSFEHVKGYPAIQILGASVALFLSAYEDIRV
ncbi:hypothetical protein MNV49_003541 [Pseudohyphozyma bogoriensis]|nr:hypothetical protein MNV49_003541 [Pseudohyphozyma bogoriensis]